MEKSIGEYLKKRLSERKMTQKQLADKIGVSKAAVSMFISGASRPSLATWERIALALDLPKEDVNRAIINITINELWKRENSLFKEVRDMYGDRTLEILKLTGLMTEEAKIKMIDRAHEILKVREYNQQNAEDED